MIRSPICAVVGHVDHGKTTLLDTLRGTATAAAEAGKITQSIGASIIPLDHIKQHSTILGKQELTVPGLLFIDTPGHAAFTGMRKRGGSLADIAILIVDINEGFKPQTKEAIEILKAQRTPFVVAANKIDLIPRYRKQSDNIIEDINAQDPQALTHIETKMYELVGQLSELGFPSERFDRLESFEKQVAIVPISALHKQGLDNLLALLVGMAQRYLEQKLHADIEGPAKGTILEVAEVQGMGDTIDTIIYDGTIHVGDTIIVGTFGDPIVTKVRALLQPAKIADFRDRKTKFIQVQEVCAATGVKISAPGLEGAAAGMPVFVVQENEKQLRDQLAEETMQTSIDTDDEGIVVKANNLGSLEALITLLREKGIPIRTASVGPLTKKDITIAASNPKEYAAALLFNVPAPKESIEDIEVLEADIIYKLIDDFEEYKERTEQEMRQEELKQLPHPARVQVLKGCIFRQSNPLVCGVEVLKGTLSQGARLVHEKDISHQVGNVKEIQDKKETLQNIREGDQAAISIPGAMAQRHVNEEDILWATITDDEFRQLKAQAKHLTPKEKETLKEFADLMREREPLWGV